MIEILFDVHMELEGWRLFWARLEVGQPDHAVLAELRDRVAAAARERFRATSEIGAHPTVTALRRLFRAAGCDPTRYRPASEALLRRLVKGDPLPEIQPLVDLNNCLSAELAVPCCVMAEGSFGRRMTWRSGRAGESYESLRGPFSLEDKPVLFDEDGPLDTPITGNVRVKVRPETAAAWLVAYMPAAELSLGDARSALEELVRGTGMSTEAFGQPE
jgi:DNA/RNA-binding domain of Phe-tRNA-synthetase-like protein